ncbi:heme NO-binding domain-containing protein [Neptunicoccus cionae]|uniref:heme NO-binding domain-containing protein n=1 Tax=Neptunicoccus cionae TaxID=2035344 RepID=UPI000C78EF68|nr:heme NO-binding domain-containing protein [Amylibacter cionae]PLS20580.1 guanylate cyclase [Amylibacter cionae]
MKGVVFVELLSLADSLIGEDAVDDVLNSTKLASGGAYSAVGNYPCRELMALLDALSHHAGTTPENLQTNFGKWIFRRFAQTHFTFMEGKTTAFQMLDSIEGEVHVEVRKLYPDAELPTFATRYLSAQSFEMVYLSERPLVDFCQGMIEACIEHFGETAFISRSPLSTAEGSGATFTIRLTTQLAA